MRRIFPLFPFFSILNLESVLFGFKNEHFSSKLQVKIFNVLIISDIRPNWDREFYSPPPLSPAKLKTINGFPLSKSNFFLPLAG